MTNEQLWARRNARIDELVSQMTLEEKCSQLVHDAPAIPRLGLPAYNWWSEGLHGVGRNGRATVFPQAMNLAATFDRELAKTEGSILGREARAKFNLARKAGWEGDQYRGLTFWSPNVNLFRDPRWGRGQETLGEDPFLSGEMGAAYVRGMQGDDPKNRMQVAACAKHYAVHSGPERDRHVFDARPPKKDFRESYLPQFERVVKAGVESVMGAYNRTYGDPCCGSKLLLTDILRDEWGFDGHVVSDCWAVMDFWKNHKTFEFDRIVLGEKDGEVTVSEVDEEYEIIAAGYSQIYPKDSDAFKYYEYAGWFDEESFNDFIAGIKAEACYDTGVTAEYGDQLVTMSTCAYQTEDGRFYVVGKRIK